MLTLKFSFMLANHTTRTFVIVNVPRFPYNSFKKYCYILQQILYTKLNIRKAFCHKIESR